MKRKIALFLCSVLCLMSTMSVCAANDVTSAGEGSVPLSFSKDSTFTVTLPEAISGGSNTSVDFDYSVEGDIAADKTITVNVEDSDAGTDGIQLALSDVSGNTKNANISVPKTDFAYNEITAKNTQTGSVSVDNLTAGSWSGVAKFVIGVDTIHIHSYTSSVTKQSTCAVDGVRTYTCDCGDTYTEAISAINQPHVDADGNGVCDVCGENITAGLYNSDGACTLSWNEMSKKGYIRDEGNTFAWTYSGFVPYTLKLPSYVDTGYAGKQNKMMVSKLIVPSGCTVGGSGPAFSGSTISTLVVESGVNLSGNAFSQANINDVILEDGITTIPLYAFDGCNGLTDITIPSSVTSIGTDAFYNIPHITYNGSATGSPWGALSIN